MRILRLALAALLFPLALPAQERHVLSGATITIWNLAGEVRLERGMGNDVVVEVTRGGSDARRLEVVASGGTLTIRYPDNEIVYRGGRDSRSSSTLTVRGDGTFNGDWGSGGRRTTVRTYGSGLEAHADLVVKVPAGKRVEVNLAVGSISADRVESDLRLDVHAASVRAAGTKGRLVIDAGSGLVHVEDASGDLEVDTGSGSTTLVGLRMTSVKVDAGSGSIDAREMQADRFSVEVGSGSVTVDGLTTDDLFVDTGSGSVRVGLTKVPGRTSIDTGSGSVSFALPADAAADLDLETGSGGISTDVPVTMEGYRRRELRGRIGAGGPMIKVSTGSGGVRLLKR